MGRKSKQFTKLKHVVKVIEIKLSLAIRERELIIGGVE